jgi:hypothetical protein
VVLCGSSVISSVAWQGDLFIGGLHFEHVTPFFVLRANKAIASSTAVGSKSTRCLLINKQGTAPDTAASFSHFGGILSRSDVSNRFISIFRSATILYMIVGARIVAAHTSLPYKRISC